MRQLLVPLIFIAGCTTRLGLFTSVLLLPQRPTALVAKQAAELDLLSGGRLRLGVGLGMISLEYEALGQDFHTRGKRLDDMEFLLFFLLLIDAGGDTTRNLLSHSLLALLDRSENRRE